MPRKINKIKRSTNHFSLTNFIIDNSSCMMHMLIVFFLSKHVGIYIDCLRERLVVDVLNF